MAGPYAHGTREAAHSAPPTEGRHMRRRATVPVTLLVLALTSSVLDDHSSLGGH